MKRAAPIRRRKPLRARRWGIRWRRPRRLDDPRQNDDARRDWTARERCIGAGRIEGHVCTGRIEVCHEGRKPGVGLKCPDAETVPMCSGLHRAWTDHARPFRGWSRAERRAWMDPIVAETQARYLSTGNRRAA